jgi:outer membrane receptor for ferrienterochelin and colicin
VFNYRQDVLALYTTYRFKVKKQLNIQLGARLEQTYINAHFISGDTSLRSGYLNFIPSVNISLPLPNMQTIALSYGRRLQRPWVWNLNPYVNDNDPNNILYGNPDLHPEFNHSFGMNYNGLVKGIRITLGTDYTFTNNAIEPYATIDSVKGITASTYANIGRRAATGFNFNAGLQPNKHWHLNVNARAMYTTLRNNNGTALLQHTGWSANSFISSDYDLGKGFKTEVSFLLNSSRPTLQGSTPGYITYTLTLRKALFHQKGTLSLNLDQPFQKEIAWKSIISDPSFYRSSTFYYPVRSIRIGFNWKFGQLTQAVSRKKGVKNDDVKQGDGSKP